MTKQQKRKRTWLSIVALLLTTAVALHTRVGQCLPPVRAEPVVTAAKRAECDAPTVVGAIIASIAEAFVLY